MWREGSLRFNNTLTRSKEPFKPIEPGRVQIYTCGPTVYRYAHIGNLRSYLMADWLRRLLEAQGYRVKQVKNITDVGHMRQDMLERGEDKVIAAALAEGKSPAQIAEHYTEAFMEDERKLNILPAHEFPRATTNVAEMVELTERLVDKGFAYAVNGNVYFEVGRFPGYGKLSRQQAEGLEESGRAEADPLKRDKRDFALWKAAEEGRTVKWPSPWGEGFPGWHIECSAMAAKYLGPVIDFHTGGVDNIFPHHEDEIAQSEAALGRQHVRNWMHGQHLLVDGLKMAKSTGNTYQVADLEQRGFEPLAFRYLCSTARYRSRLNFTLASLRAAQKGLLRLRGALHRAQGRASKRAAAEGEKLRTAFWGAAADDLNLPRALAIAWRVARSRLPGPLKRELLMDFDRLLGLDLLMAPVTQAVSQEIEGLVRERDSLRLAKTYEKADALREQMLVLGYEVRDTRAGTLAMPRARWAETAGAISSSGDVESLLDTPDEVNFSVSIVANQGCEVLERCLNSVRRWAGESTEILVVDNGFQDGCGTAIDELATQDSRVRVFHADHFLGTAAGRNVTLRQARGRFILMLDTSVELEGDVFAPLSKLLDGPRAGIAGRWGVISSDLREFEEAESSGEVDAVEGYLIGFRRELLKELGLLDEKYRFYRHLDLDLSLAARTAGYRALIDTALPVARHEHIEWSATPPEERERLSKRNFYRFLRKWGTRTDLLVAQAR
ncbi:MAG TPA: cysteine--tRNA ligase [Dehalococcoidia bacterium]|jgi:cysteinyl-tRNA synthetase|nr:cysteine--tRNA ligase [Dehalococcoidia bacterium]